MKYHIKNKNNKKSLKKERMKRIPLMDNLLRTMIDEGIIDESKRPKSGRKPISANHFNCENI